MMAGGQGTNSNFTVFWVLRCQYRRGKSLVYLNDDQQRKFAAKPDLFHARSANYYEPVHEIPNNVVCATSEASDQPAHTRSLIRAFACRFSIL